MPPELHRQVQIDFTPPFRIENASLPAILLAESLPSYGKWKTTLNLSREDHARLCFASGMELLYAAYGKLPKEDGIRIPLKPSDFPIPRKLSIYLNQPSKSFWYDIHLGEADERLAEVKSNLASSQGVLDWNATEAFLRENRKTNPLVALAIKRLKYLCKNDVEKKILYSLLAIRLMNQLINQVSEHEIPEDLPAELLKEEGLMPDYGAVLVDLSDDAKKHWRSDIERVQISEI